MADIDIESDHSRAEIATYFRNFADELERADTSDRDVTDATHATETGDSKRSTGTTTDRTADTDPADSHTDSSHPVDTHSSATQPDDETRDAARDDSVTIIVGNESATINPPDTMRFRIEVKSDSSMLSAGEDRMARFTLQWTGEEVEPTDDIRIE